MRSWGRPLEHSGCYEWEGFLQGFVSRFLEAMKVGGRLDLPEAMSNTKPLRLASAADPYSKAWLPEDLRMCPSPLAHGCTLSLVLANCEVV